MKRQVYILIRSWKCFPYLRRCLHSVRRQRDQDFTVLFIDDASGYSPAEKRYIRQTLTGQIIQFNTARKYSIRNAFEAIHTYVQDNNAIILNLDGDDWLASDTVVSTIKRTYDETACLLTYGNCQYYAPLTGKHNAVSTSFGNTNHRYPDEIEAHNTYRNTYFIPLHLRTWNAGLFKRIQKKSFLRPDGSWQRTCEDEAMYFPMLEMAHGKYTVLDEILYIYNIENIRGVHKSGTAEILYDELCIYRQTPYTPI
jgi:glycosyltransferase involved in cell wall biosynthesis